RTARSASRTGAARRGACPSAVPLSLPRPAIFPTRCHSVRAPTPWRAHGPWGAAAAPRRQLLVRPGRIDNRGREADSDYTCDLLGSHRLIPGIVLFDAA